MRCVDEVPDQLVEENEAMQGIIDTDGPLPFRISIRSRFYYYSNDILNK